jgi:uncharacterized membrane protein YkoI
MVKRLLTLAFLVVVLSTFAAAANAQDNGNGQGNGNSQGGGQENGNGQGNNGQGSENSQAVGGNPSDAAASAGANSAAPETPPGKPDEDLALEAVQSDNAVPLGDILESVRQDTDSRVIDAQLFSLRGDLVYEVKVMSADGHVSRLYYRASSGRQFSPD